MLTIKCPHCSTALKLRQAPPSGKVKCPKCSNAVAVNGSATKAPAAGQPRRAPAAAPRPADPNDDTFDFGRISFPSAAGANAVTSFPSSGELSAYEGPIPGDPLEAVDSEEGDGDESGAGASIVAAPKKRNPKLLIGALVGGGVLLIACVAGVALMMMGNSGDTKKEDVVAAARSTAPEGYKAIGIEGCVVLMPKGTDYDSDKLPSKIECAGLESSGTGSIFFMGAMSGGERPLDTDQMRKKAGRQLGGEILGGTETKRNGYTGIKGILDGSLFLPRMQVEIFHVDGRFVILACAPASMGADPAVQMQIDRALEMAEQDIFYGSFKIGDRPSGWF